MKQKKFLTKQEMSWIHSYENAKVFSVNTAYSRPSETKRQIESEIMDRMRHDFNGENYRIMSHNVFEFTCGFTTTDETGTFLIVCSPTKWFNVVPMYTINQETGEVYDWIERTNNYWKVRKN